MFDQNRLPPKIAKRVNGLAWEYDKVGMSGSTILLYDDMVQKIEKVSRSSINEKMLLEWLDGKLPVPEIIEHEIYDAYSFLLMSKMPGEMACSNENMHHLDKTISALAKGLRLIW